MSQPSWIGYKLGGRYEVEELLGQGGMSTVYRATDPNLRRTVAIKLIHPHLSGNPEFVRRFEEEAAAVAQLNHPNIIKVFDFNHEGDTYYMVLEFLAGETLYDRLARLNAAGRHMPIAQAVEIMAGICDAVDYAHRRGMIHRDIKPANVMLSTQGSPILMDFGVAKIIGGEQHTATGAVVGTALYMSPEQVRGERPSERSDIYALGVTLFECVSGRRPYEADSAMTTMMMHVNDPIPDVRELAPDTPQAIQDIINQALAKNPDERFRTAGAMATALRGASLARPGEQPGAAAAGPGSTFVEQTPAEAPYEGTFIETPPAPPVEPARPGGTLVETPPQPTPAAMPAPPAPQAVSDTRSPASTGARAPQAAPRKGGLPTLAIVGGIGGLLVVICLVVGIIALPRLLGGSLGGVAGAAGAAGVGVETTPTPDEQAEVVAVVEETPIPTEAPTDAPPPTDPPTPDATPTPTDPPGPYVRINSIEIDPYNTYVVEYEPFGYTPALPGMHIHFYFDTVPPESAGVPGAGPWYLYGGPNPFRGYTLADRPPGATQMCALVANPDHSILPDTGNCVALP